MSKILAGNYVNTPEPETSATRFKSFQEQTDEENLRLKAKYQKLREEAEAQANAQP